jgi:hypothetical protein
MPSGRLLMAYEQPSIQKGIGEVKYGDGSNR